MYLIFKFHSSEGSINATAHNIQIKELSEMPQPTLTDLLGARVGDKVYKTDNLYQQEQLVGEFMSDGELLFIFFA